MKKILVSILYWDRRKELYDPPTVEEIIHHITGKRHSTSTDKWKYRRSLSTMEKNGLAASDCSSCHTVFMLTEKGRKLAEEVEYKTKRALDEWAHMLYRGYYH